MIEICYNRLKAMNLAKGGEEDYIYDKILLMAVSHGCVYECEKLTKDALESGTFTEELTSRLGKVFSPLQSC